MIEKKKVAYEGRPISTEPHRLKLFLEGKSRNEVKKRLYAVCGDSSPSMGTIKENRLSEQRRSFTISLKSPDTPTFRLG